MSNDFRFLPYTVTFNLDPDNASKDSRSPAYSRSPFKSGSGGSSRILSPRFTDEPAVTDLPDILPSLNQRSDGTNASNTTLADSVQEFFLGPNNLKNKFIASPAHFIDPSEQLTPNSRDITRPNSPAYLQLNFGAKSRALPQSRASSPPPKRDLVEPRRKTGGKEFISVRVAPPKQQGNVSSTSISKHSELDSPISQPIKDFDTHLTSAALSPTMKYVGRNMRSRRMTYDMTEIFSNAPWRVEPQNSGNGGLKNAVQRAQSDKIIDTVTWIGSLGFPTDSLKEDTKESISNTLTTQYDCSPIYVSDQTMEGHYNHYCKQILWPTLHYQIPDNAKSKAYEDHSWELYKAMNQAVADGIIKSYREGDTIWINDYHLLLTPKMVRDKLPNAKIGFFMHVAFPSSEVFRCLAARSQLLEGILAADCIGFQIPEYARHFLQTCNRILAVDATPYGIKLEKRFVSVVVEAIGVDTDALKSCIEDKEVLRWRQMIREKWPDSKLIVGRDKLDNIRGVKQKLQAYELFLIKHPEMIDKVVLIQVCLMNKSEPELESDVTAIVDRINSMRSNIASSQPCVFLHKDIDFVQHIALSAEASAFAVTSVREGMNLTCHEFIFCNTLNAPLVLSEFTGAASVLGGDTLLVNPWDRNEMADAFYTALTMDQDEKSRRWENLKDYVANNTCVTWINDWLQDMDRAWAEQQRRQLAAVPQLSLLKFREDYQNVPKNKFRMFFLDLDYASALSEFQTSPIRRSSSTNSLYSLSSDGSNSSPGTIRPISGNSLAVSNTMGSSSSSDLKSMSSRMSEKKNGPFLSPQRKLSMMYELVDDPKNIVYIMSSDSRSTVERLFKNVPKVGLIAGNGAYLRSYSSEEWIELQDAKTDEWRGKLEPLMSDVIERIPGAKLETVGANTIVTVKDCIDKDRLNSTVGDLVNHINNAFSVYDVHAVYQDDKVVIGSAKLGKFSAIKKAFMEEKARLRMDPNVIIEDGVSPIQMMFVGAEGGDDETDQIFEWTNSLPNGISGIEMHRLASTDTSSESVVLSGITGSSSVVTGTTSGSAVVTDDAISGSVVSSRDGDAWSLNSDNAERVDMFSGSRSGMLKIPSAYSVSVGGKGTYAQYMVDGLNGLLTAISKAMSTK